MHTIIFLNKWHDHLYHVILAASDEELDYTLASRVCTISTSRGIEKVSSPPWV